MLNTHPTPHLPTPTGTVEEVPGCNACRLVFTGHLAVEVARALQGVCGWKNVQAEMLGALYPEWRVVLAAIGTDMAARPTVLLESTQEVDDDMQVRRQCMHRHARASTRCIHARSRARASSHAMPRAVCRTPAGARGRAAAALRRHAALRGGRVWHQ